MVERLPTIAHLTSVHQVDDIRIFVKECRSLAAAGFDVALIGPSPSDRETEGVKIMGVPAPANRIQRMTVTLWQVLKRAFQSKARICHFHDPELIPVGFLLKLAGRQVVYDVHEDYPRDIMHKDWINPHMRRLLAGAADVVEWGVTRVIDGTIAVTPDIAARFPKTKTITLRNFPSLAELGTKAPVPYQQRPFKVCYVGGLTINRGVFDMIDAIGALDTDGIDDPCLALAGRFANPSDEAESRAMPGWARTDHLGWQERDEVVRLLGNVRAGLVVLHATPSYQRAYPIKLFEYMAAGLPTIASDFPLYREILDDGRCGLLVPPSDPAAMTEAIEWLFTHPDEAEEMGERARERVEAHYSWEAERHRLFELYKQIAA